MPLLRRDSNSKGLRRNAGEAQLLNSLVSLPPCRAKALSLLSSFDSLPLSAVAKGIAPEKPQVSSGRPVAATASGRRGGGALRQKPSWRSSGLRPCGRESKELSTDARSEGQGPGRAGSERRSEAGWRAHPPASRSAGRLPQADTMNQTIGEGSSITCPSRSGSWCMGRVREAGMPRVRVHADSTLRVPRAAADRFDRLPREMEGSRLEELHALGRAPLCWLACTRSGADAGYLSLRMRRHDARIRPPFSRHKASGVGRHPASGGRILFE